MKRACATLTVCMGIGNTLTLRSLPRRLPVHFPYTNIWDDTATGGFADTKIYVVQTRSKVIERCMLMCTDPGDLVLDPTCGSGTTAYVAEQWGRRWITIDTSRVALALARQRVMGAKYPWYLLADTAEGHKKEQSLTTQVLPRQEFGGDIRQGFVYERVQHITLKSIANNPDIKEGMTREQIDEAIKRHADFELLYDKPYEDKNKVRVSGPFTVESLSPHRSLAFAGGADDANRESISQTSAAQQPDAADLRAVDPRQPREGGHPERPSPGADHVLGVRVLRRLLHPGGRRPRRRPDAERMRRRRGSPSRSARSTAR